MESVEGLAYDWISHNLYFVDGGRKVVELVTIGTEYRWRSTVIKNSTETPLEIPRGIALHPVKGYVKRLTTIILFIGTNISAYCSFLIGLKQNQ